uniref:Uncharacterized protein n=1 Tax=Macaca fascicularis TaxID=9541 RepID=A0A7N9CKY3_MACFA
KGTLWPHKSTVGKGQGGQGKTRIRCTILGLLRFLLLVRGTIMDRCSLDLPGLNRSSWRDGGLTMLP